MSSSGCAIGYSENHGCFNALAAVILLLGSRVSIYLIKSIPASDIRHSFGMISLSLIPGYLGKLICIAIGRFFHPGQISSVGVPNNLNIWSKCSSSFKQLNKGFLRINSTNIHPADHISI